MGFAEVDSDFMKKTNEIYCRNVTFYWPRSNQVVHTSGAYNIVSFELPGDDNVSSVTDPIGREPLDLEQVIVPLPSKTS